MDWGIIAGITTAATALFTGYAILQRAMEWPRPRWSAHRNTRAFGGPDGAWYTDVTVQNVGDGAAFDVRLEVVGGRELQPTLGRRRAASVPTGESLTIQPIVAIDAPLSIDPHGIPLDLELRTADVGDVRVRVTWSHPPHRWRTRQKSWSVRDI